MSENTSMSLLDTQATPVAHTFQPISTINGIAAYRDDDQAQTVGLRPTVTASLRQGSLGNVQTRAQRVKRRVVLKVMVPFQPPAVDGITPAVDTCEVEMRISLPLDAPVLSVNDCIKYARTAVDTAPIYNMVRDGEFPY